MNKKWIGAMAAALLPTLAVAQTDIAVENTGTVERPMAEGQVVPDFNYVHTILWTDSGADAYNVYVSAAPITDTGASNVFQIGTDIPAGQQAYEYALHTPHRDQVGDAMNYYAVTAVGSSEITAGVNATTEATPGTWEFAQPFYWFTEEPFIDAEFSDWAAFEPVSMSPESPDNFFAGEIDDAADYSGVMAMGVNAEAVFLRAEMTDDALVNVNETGTGDIWQGDAIEWYVGYYDMRPSAPRHPLSQFGNESDPSAAEPDWQLVIAANAFDDAQRSHSFDGSAADNAGSFNRPLGDAGLETFTTETADGWAIEGRLPHAGMQFEPSLLDVYAPKFGQISPCVYVGNDGDDPAGGRQGQLFWATNEGVNNAWNTPASWEKQHVIYDPRVFGEGGSTAVESKTWGQVKAGFGE